MRIGINGILLDGPASGATRRIENLIQALLELEQEIVLYVNKEAKPRVAAHPRLKVVRLSIPSHPPIARAAAERLRLTKQLKQDQLDFFECSHFPALNTGSVSLLVTIHDLRHLAIPKYSPLSKRLFSKKIYREAFQRAWKILTVSEFTKNEILKYFDVESEKIAVIPNAADHFKPAPRKIAREKMILYVGHIEPRKNLVLLVKAFADLKQKGFPHQLLIAGQPKGNHAKTLQSLTRKLGIQESIEWLEQVDDQELSKLYARAEIFAFPSLHEGFGIPILEAMRAGVPVIAADSSSIPEVGGKACLYAKPDSVKDWEEKLAKLATNSALREKLVAEGYRQESKFRWENSAETLISLLSLPHSSVKPQ